MEPGTVAAELNDFLSILQKKYPTCFNLLTMKVFSLINLNQYLLYKR